MQFGNFFSHDGKQTRSKRHANHFRYDYDYPKIMRPSPGASTMYRPPVKDFEVEVIQRICVQSTLRRRLSVTLRFSIQKLATSEHVRMLNLDKAQVVQYFLASLVGSEEMMNEAGR